MTFMKKMNFIFLGVITLSILLLLISWYKEYKFDNNPISDEINHKITKKSFEIRELIKKRYKINLDIPVLITDKVSSKLFGATTYDSKTKKIVIYLNKKRFKESLSYMIDDVIPHEYAHALMFKFGLFPKKNGGHTKKWQNICRNLNGKRCDRFVNHNDILIDKTKLFY